MRLTCLVPLLVILAWAPAAEARPRAKQPHQARALSAATTLASLGVGAALVATDDETLAVPGIALLAGGALVGPSAGLWYAGHPGGKGIAIRATTLAIATGALVVAVNLRPGDCPNAPPTPGAPPVDCDAQERRYRNDELQVAAVLGVAMLGYLASAAYDIHAAGRVTRTWNATHGFSLGPTVIPAAGGGRAPGAALSLRF